MMDNMYWMFPIFLPMPSYGGGGGYADPPSDKPSWWKRLLAFFGIGKKVVTPEGKTVVADTDPNRPLMHFSVVEVQRYVKERGVNLGHINDWTTRYELSLGNTKLILDIQASQYIAYTEIFLILHKIEQDYVKVYNHERGPWNARIREILDEIHAKYDAERKQRAELLAKAID